MVTAEQIANIAESHDLQRAGVLSRLHDPTVCRCALFLIVMIAAVVRVGWALRQPSDLALVSALPDQREYVELAQSLARGATMGFYDERFGETVYAYRTPGYPAFLAMTGPSPRAARLLQAMIDASTVLATFLLARRWLAPPAALFAASLVALNPFLVYFSGLLLSETLYTALLTWAATALAYAPRAWWIGAAGGLLLVAGAIVRPSSLFLILLLPLSTPALPLPRRGALALVAVLFVALMFGPWAMRNERVLGRAVLATTNGGITLYDGFHPGATGASDQRFVAHMPQLREMTELQRSDYLEAQAWRFIGDNPVIAVRLAAVKLARMWSPIPLSAEFGRPLYVVVGLLYAVPLYAMVVWGLWRPPALSRSVKVFLLGAGVYFSAVHVMSVGSLRYRVPVEPMLCVIAASAAQRADWEGTSDDVR